MSIFAIKNNEGKWLGCEIYCDEPDWFEHGGFMWDTQSVAEENVKLYGGHVVELVEAQTKVVVSEDEAEILEQAKDTTVWRPASVIAGYAYEHEQQGDDEALLEDRLMHAYVIGWTVEKPKQFVLPMEGTKLADGTIAYATLDHTGVWTIKAYSKKQSAVVFHDTVAQADIDAAPDWVKAITPVEVTDDEQ